MMRVKESAIKRLHFKYLNYIHLSAFRAKERGEGVHVLHLFIFGSNVVIPFRVSKGGALQAVGVDGWRELSSK